jgi:hypothetical protein
MSQDQGWAVSLNGVMLTQCGHDTADCAGDLIVLEGMDGPPDGLGPPGIRNEDVVYTQRDGVRHFNDWYESKAITIVGTLGPSDCETCTTTREQLFQLMDAWGRSCCDVEMVIYPPCDPVEEPTCATKMLTGPYGVIGRPRLPANPYTWADRSDQIVDFILRFDTVDQRMFLLDECGTPGVGDCYQIEPGVALTAACFPICMTGEGLCFTTLVTTDDSVLPTDVGVCGTETAAVTITFNPILNTPTIQNLTTEDFITFNGEIGVDDQPVVVNTEDMTATQGETDVTYLLSGSPSFRLDPGDYELRLLNQGVLPDDPDTVGNAVVCVRAVVVAA